MGDLGAVFHHPIVLLRVPCGECAGHHAGGGHHAVGRREHPFLGGQGQPIEVQVGRPVEDPPGTHRLDQIIEQRLIDQHQIEFGQPGPPQGFSQQSGGAQGQWPTQWIRGERKSTPGDEVSRAVDRPTLPRQRHCGPAPNLGVAQAQQMRHRDGIADMDDVMPHPGKLARKMVASHPEHARSAGMAEQCDPQLLHHFSPDSGALPARRDSIVSQPHRRTVGGGRRPGRAPRAGAATGRS